MNPLTYIIADKNTEYLIYPQILHLISTFPIWLNKHIYIEVFVLSPSSTSKGNITLCSDSPFGGFPFVEALFKGTILDLIFNSSATLLIKYSQN